MTKTYYIDTEITADSARDLRVFCDTLDDTDNVVFYFNSGGGSVVAGMMMYDTIAALTCETRACIIGMCASAATYPALACDVVEMSRNATMMIHPVAGGLYGTIKEIERDLEYMEDLERRVVAIYAAKAQYITADRVAQLMQDTTYMDAQTALDYGFVDIVEGLERQELTETETETETEETETEETEETKEEDGLINKVLSLAGLKKRGEIIKAPIEDEQDKDAMINSLEADKAELQLKLDNADKSLANKQAEFESYKAEQVAKLEAAQAEFANQIAAVQDTIKTEVHNHLAALGYNADDLPAPVAPANKTANAQTLANLCKEMGI